MVLTIGQYFQGHGGDWADTSYARVDSMINIGNVLIQQNNS